MKRLAALLIAATTLLLCSCSKKENQAEMKYCVTSGFVTWFEDGMFYTDFNSAGESVLCYYSKTDDRSAVICGNPECTHASKTSPDCTALLQNGTRERYGVNRIGDKLYFFEDKLPIDDSSLCSFDLIVCDADGKNRKAAASIGDVAAPFITSVRYSDGHVLVSYYVMYEFGKSEETGEIEFLSLEKHKFYMQWIDISTGEIETLVAREDYNGWGSGARINDAVFYSYSYNLEPPTGELLTPETEPKKYGGFYVRDLATGEETEYEHKTPIYYDSDKVICNDRDNKKLCVFDTESKTFTDIADYDGGGYAGDGKDALFGAAFDSDEWTHYNFETGELTQIPRFNGELKFILNTTHVIGDTVWMQIECEGYPIMRQAYIDRDDFFTGKFENITFIKEAELQ